MVVVAECPLPVLNGKIVLSSESILKNSFPDNSVAFVECAKGYERDEGPTSITCVNGAWSPVKLICKSNLPLTSKLGHSPSNKLYQLLNCYVCFHVRDRLWTTYTFTTYDLLHTYWNIVWCIHTTQMWDRVRTAVAPTVHIALILVIDFCFCL